MREAVCAQGLAKRQRCGGSAETQTSLQEEVILEVSSSPLRARERLGGAAVLRQGLGELGEYDLHAVLKNGRRP